MTPGGAVPDMSMIYRGLSGPHGFRARHGARRTAALRYLSLLPQDVSTRCYGRLAAALELISRTSLTYKRPDYGIDKVLVGNQELEVTEEVLYATPFGSLLHFKKENSPEQPRMLLVAPMSGHFATLLRATVKTLLQDHDVYITDWHNPRDMPLSDGEVRPRRIYRAPDRFPRPARSARASGGYLPALGVGARRRRHHVRG